MLLSEGAVPPALGNPGSHTPLEPLTRDFAPRLWTGTGFGRGLSARLLLSVKADVGEFKCGAINHQDLQKAENGHITRVVPACHLK
jgi:hypothetical protein